MRSDPRHIMSAVPHSRLGLPVRATANPGQRHRVVAARGRPEPKAKRSSFRAALLAPGAAALDAAVNAILAFGIGHVWGSPAATPSFLPLGLLIACFYALATVARGGYGIAAYLHPRRELYRSAKVWGVTCLNLIALTALVDPGHLARGPIVWFCGIGLAAVLSSRAVFSWRIERLAGQGRIAARSVFVVGDEQAIQEFLGRADLEPTGTRLTGSAVIRSDHCRDDLTLAAAWVRMIRPDDVLILGHWPDRHVHRRCMDTFLRLPVDIHIGPDCPADVAFVSPARPGFARVVRSGIDPLQAGIKRGFDLVLGTMALIAFAPLLTLVAGLIKLDSRGPVFFRQTRYGYNQEPFRIVKFRTMVTLEDGAVVRQAQRNDVRVTRVGRFLRRTSIDELPQLINVILGDMSLVGPRPHAIAHDQAFERDVPLYGRRHNMKPGITGWAQVHGLRGEIDTPDKIGQRVAHDLFYIDHWSLWLDLSVLVRTVLSRRTYLNAH